MERTSPIRLAFVDDHPTLLRGLATIFGSDARYAVAATGASADEAIGIAEAGQAQILVIDLSMPGDVFAAMSAIVERQPTLKLIVFTAFANVELALKALDAGAHAFVLKGRPSEDLNDAIDAVLRGELYVSPEFSQRLVAGFRNRSRREALATVKLSAREQQLVDLLLKGMSNKEMARALQLTEKTVKHYMTNLMTKLHVKSRLEVVLMVQSTQRPANVFEHDALAEF